MSHIYLLVLESLPEKWEATRILLEIEMLESFILEGPFYFETLSLARAVLEYSLLPISTREPFLPTSGLGPRHTDSCRGSWLNPLVAHRHFMRHHFKAKQAWGSPACQHDHQGWPYHKRRACRVHVGGTPRIHSSITRREHAPLMDRTSPIQAKSPRARYVTDLPHSQK